MIIVKPRLRLSMIYISQTIQRFFSDSVIYAISITSFARSVSPYGIDMRVVYWLMPNVFQIQHFIFASPLFLNSTVLFSTSIQKSSVPLKSTKNHMEQVFGYEGKVMGSNPNSLEQPRTMMRVSLKSSNSPEQSIERAMAIPRP